MERRRRGLGLKRPASENGGSNDKDKTPKKSKLLKNFFSRKIEEKGCNEGDRKGPSETECIAHQQRTPKRPVQVIYPPAASSSMESMFPRMLGSPEIEVSWDWSCSQVPKDMLPPKPVKQANQSKQPSPIVSPLVHNPRVIRNRQMSEEENQARLEFYKNVLSEASKCNEEEHPKNDIVDKLENKANPDLTTPKRTKTLLVGNEHQISEMFDDSVDELMVECSQAIEEQIKNGQIIAGSDVNINIGNQKHGLSPDFESENSRKRFCHGKSKLNLFPESSEFDKEKVKTGVGKSRLSLRSPKTNLLKNNSNQTPKQNLVSNEKNMLNSDSGAVNSKSNYQSVLKNVSINTDNGFNRFKNGEKVVATNEDVTKLRLNEQSKPDMLNRPAGNSNSTTSERGFPQSKGQLTLNNNSISHNITGQLLRVQQNVNNAHYDSVDKFRRKPISVHNQNQLVHKANGTCKPVINTVPIKTNQVPALNPVLMNTLNNNKSEQKSLTNTHQGTKQQCNDLTSLLDDEFDMELSNLDFDSLCCNSQEPVAPKVCTQDEIEAKRLAAVSRLMMKRRR